jgi:hypothetical protein
MGSTHHQVTQQYMISFYSSIGKQVLAHATTYWEKTSSLFIKKIQATIWRYQIT